MIMTDDLYQKVEDAPRLSSRGLLYTALSLLLMVSGCGEKKVEITGQVTKVDKSFYFAGPSVDEETGKVSSFSHSACIIYVDSDGTEYKLTNYESGNQELCELIIDAIAGVQCCDEFRKQYGDIQVYANLSDRDKKCKDVPTSITGECEGVKCTYDVFKFYDDNNHSYTIEIHDHSKSPTITLVTSLDNIEDDTTGDGKVVHFRLKQDQRYGASKDSTLTVDSSSYASDKAMETGGPVMSMFKKLSEQTK